MRKRSAKVAVLAAVAFAAVAAAPLDSAQQSDPQQAAQQSPVQQQVPQAVRTTEQQFKNIKVLTGMPANQLNLTMHLISGSLGVECVHCHVWDQWDKDVKPAKAVARRMMTMVQEMNKNFFGGAQVVTCYTCHRGSARPVGTIMLPGKPEFPVDDGQGHVYANIEDSSEIVEIDAAKATVTKKYALTGCDGPSGLAMDTKNRRLFSVCGNRVMAVSDPDKGTVVATPPIGAGSDGVIFDPGTGYAISANGDGTMTVVQQTGGKYDVTDNIATERGARTIALDEKTHRVYTPTAAPATGGGRGYLPDSFKVLVVGK